jgi:CO/xanthine dehydrogenase Mo-binding subunit
VSVVDCGRVASPVTAASQVRGGVVGSRRGVARDQRGRHKRFGGFFNATLEEYPISVNADIGEIDVDFIDPPSSTRSTTPPAGGSAACPSRSRTCSNRATRQPRL